MFLKSESFVYKTMLIFLENSILKQSYHLRISKSAKSHHFTKHEKKIPPISLSIIRWVKPRLEHRSSAQMCYSS